VLDRCKRSARSSTRRGCHPHPGSDCARRRGHDSADPDRAERQSDQVSILGNDTFCISAIKALKTLGYTKQIVAAPACISDASKKALGSQLKGVVEFTSASTNKNAHEVALYNAVMAKYAKGTKKDANTGEATASRWASLAP